MAGRKARRHVRSGTTPPREQATSLGITVGWMMSALSAACADAAALFCWGLAQWFPQPYLVTLKNLGLFIGLVAGILAAILYVAARFVRTEPAPRSVVIISWIITAVSIVMAFVQPGLGR